MSRWSLRQWFGRLGASTEELASSDRKRVAEACGADTIGASKDRQKVNLRGTIEVLTVRPRLTTPWLEAQLSDGTGKVTLIWMGRHEIAGVEAGRELLVNGRISDVDGERRIYNPAYTLL